MSECKDSNARLKRVLCRGLKSMKETKKRIKNLHSFHIIDNETLDVTEDRITMSCPKGNYVHGINGAEMGDLFSDIQIALLKHIDWEIKETKEHLERILEQEDDSCLTNVEILELIKWAEENPEKVPKIKPKQ